MRTRYSTTYHVYILTNASRTLYIGMTSNLTTRMQRHKAGIGSDFTRRYNITQLVYAEPYGDPLAAIEREKQLKSWSRIKKINLITKSNPNFKEIPID